MSPARSRQNGSVNYFGCIKFSLRLVVVRLQVVCCYSYRHPMFSALVYLQLGPLQNPVSGSLSNTWGAGSFRGRCHLPCLAAAPAPLPQLRSPSFPRRPYRCLAAVTCPAALPESDASAKVFQTHLEIGTDTEAGNGVTGCRSAAAFPPALGRFQTFAGAQPFAHKIRVITKLRMVLLHA